MILLPDKLNNLAGETLHPAGQPEATHKAASAQSWAHLLPAGLLFLQWPRMKEEMSVKDSQERVCGIQKGFQGYVCSQFALQCTAGQGSLTYRQRGCEA